MYGVVFSKVESVLRVVRVQLDSGDRVIGIRYPQPLIALVETAIVEQKAVTELARQQQVSADWGDTITLTLPPAPNRPC